MKTVITKRIEVNLDELQFGYWDEENEKFTPLDQLSDEETNRLATVFACSPKLLDTLVMFSDSIKEYLSSDLVDIWERLDKLENDLKSIR